jgi:putative PIN family toxin of toxin-antitoxin system
VAAVLSRGGRSALLLRAFEEGRFAVVTSEPVQGEAEEVLERPELIRSGDARMRARSLLADLRQRAEFVAITGTLKLCRDAKDDMVIETAAVGRVDALVSEDKDLTDDPALAVTLGTFGVRVVTLAQFLDELDPGN